MTKLVYVLGGMYNGGQERQLLNLTSYLVTAGYDCQVVIWNSNNHSAIARNRFEDNNVPCLFLKGTKSKKLAALKEVAQQATLLHSFTFYMNSFVFLACRGTRALAIGGLRGDYKQYASTMGKSKAIINALFPRIMIANSKVQADALSQHFSFLAPKIQVVRNGFKGKDEGKVIQEIEDRFELICISRIVGYKRFDLLLTAVSKLKGNWHLSIIGTGNLENEMKELSIKLGCSDRISWVGEVEDVSQYISKAHLMVHLSDFEGTCNVIMESIAMGRPVIATEVGENSFLVQDAHNGFLVKKGDAQKSAEYIQLLMDTPDLVKKMSAQAMDYAKSHFSMDVYAKNTLAAYQEFGIKTLHA